MELTKEQKICHERSIELMHKLEGEMQTVKSHIAHIYLGNVGADEYRACISEFRTAPKTPIVPKSSGGSPKKIG